jgi:hypothetical protein
MKILFVIYAIAMLPFALSAQKRVPLPHGMTFGQKVNNRQNMPASSVEAFMGKLIRISTTITGKVLKVDTPKGGWFQLDAGNGRIIKVHFKDYDVTIPTQLKGRQVMIEGVAQKQLVADDMQHFAGDTVKGAKQHNIKVNPKQMITFEAKGLMVL